MQTGSNDAQSSQATSAQSLAPVATPVTSTKRASLTSNEQKASKRRFPSSSSDEEYTGFGVGDNDAASHHGLTGKKLMIYKAVKKNKNERGISKQDLHNKFPHVPMVELE